MRQVRNGLLIVIAAVLLFGLSPAQDKYKTGEAPSHQDLRYKTDLEFARMLDKPWMKVEILPGLRVDTHPKPIDQPVAEVTGDDLEDLEDVFDKSRRIEPPPLPEPAPRPQPEPVVKPAPIPPRPDTEALNFSFFATPVALRYDPALKVPGVKLINNRTISDFWESTSRTDYRAFLKQADYYQGSLRLNDWGYAMFLKEIGSEIYPESANKATLFAWFMLVKAGYDARIGYEKNNVYLLLPSNRAWYQVPYFTIADRYYYVVTEKSASELGPLHVYGESYPNAERLIDVRLQQSPAVQKAVAAKTLQFSDRNSEHSITVNYNKSLVDFYDQYPLTDLDVYFHAAVSEEVSTALLTGLNPLVQGKSEAEAVNVILHFVQSAFPYKTDGEQFGREKYFFAEEAVYYPYCDCEDRSVLFAHLVDELTGLEVIGLDYPGHVAAAVLFSDDLPGDDVIHKGKKYLVCDPTYIGANVGMCMPQYSDTEPKVISIKS